MLFKVLDGKKATNGGSMTYPRLGAWTQHIDGPLVACERGYHLARDAQLLSWLGATIYEAEPCPTHGLVDAGDKMVTCQTRLVRKLSWDDRVARLFAADCAESALLGERASGREPEFGDEWVWPEAVVECIEHWCAERAMNRLTVDDLMAGLLASSQREGE